MDYRFAAVPGVICGHDGPHGLRPALAVWSKVAVHGRVFWVYRLDPLLFSRGELLPFFACLLPPLASAPRGVPLRLEHDVLTWARLSPL